MKSTVVLDRVRPVGAPGTYLERLSAESGDPFPIDIIHLMSTQVCNLDGRTPEELNIVNKLLGYFTFPSKNKLTVLLDSRDDILWRDKSGYHLCLEKRIHNLDETFPYNFETLIDEQRSGCAIWIAPKSRLNNEIDFCWTVAHELQHHHQHLNNSLLHSQDLENDANEKAKDLSVRIFGEEKIREFLGALDKDSHGAKLSKLLEQKH
jgi:hypothetical protein